MQQKKVGKMLGLESRVRTLSIKCYEEQMPNGWKDVKQRVKRFPKSQAFT